MSYRSETTALRAERDALRAELRQQRQRNDALERALRGEPEPEPPEPPPEQRSASSQGASGPLKAGLAVILALPILCGGAAAVLLVIQPSAA
ncbi:MAG: hypothetical protein KC503_43725, partial [Myxococcales bacterium]|nr:hypothetical protein [Myxococcales bacterium]